MAKDELTRRIRERYDAEYDLHPPFPTKRMKVEVSFLCNHACIFCGRQSNPDAGGLIKEDVFDRIVREAYELGVREIGLFINGEPFTSKNLARHVKTAKDIGYEYVYITTNGALATPERLVEVIEAGLDSIKFSINAGTRETYAQVHGKDDFGKVCANLRFCHEYRQRSGRKYNIFGSSVMTKYLAPEIDALREKIGPYLDEHLVYKMRDAWGGIEKGKELSGTEFTAHTKCTLPFNTINVSHEGLLLACCEDINHTIVVGDLNTASLKDAWYGERMTRIRRMHLEGLLDGTMCGSCLRGGGGVVEIISEK